MTHIFKEIHEVRFFLMGFFFLDCAFRVLIGWTEAVGN